MTRSFLCCPAIAFLIVFSSCEKPVSNGETIFRTGKNLEGEIVAYSQDLGIKRPMGCEGCHGRSGGHAINKDESIKYRHLTDPELHAVPYTDDLIRRFLREKLKSDGTRANTPVITKMSEKDENDLIGFLKTL